jgi:hypothetical protein
VSESILNISYIQNYAKEFAGRTADRFFADRDSVTGGEILGISGIRQVDLLVVRQIYSNWKAEMENFRSPYFNYRSAEVQEAMNRFVNVLSRNILIGRTDFEPLLREASEQALRLILSPYEFYMALFNTGNKEYLTTEGLKAERKYISVNSHLFDSLLQQMDGEKLVSEKKERVIGIFNSVCGKSTGSPEDPEKLIAGFSKVLAFDIQGAYREKETEPGQAPKPKTAHEVISSGIPKDKKSILDEYQGSKSSTIADFLQQKAVESIRKSITIHQKFLFVRELFNEDESSFTHTIDELDAMKNFEDAENYISERFFSNNRWQRESETVGEFFEVLQKKFS